MLLAETCQKDEIGMSCNDKVNERLKKLTKDKLAFVVGIVT